MTERKTESEGGTHVDSGLGGLFKGIGSFMELLSGMIEEGESEINRHGEFKVRGLDQARGVYGFSVRTGLGGAPTVEHFGNIRDTDKGPVVAEEREPLVDVFDEGDLILIVAELPGVDESDIQIDIQDDIVDLSTKGEGRFVKEVLLPSLVDADSMESTYRNGILEIRLRKV